MYIWEIFKEIVENKDLYRKQDDFWSCKYICIV